MVAADVKPDPDTSIKMEAADRDTAMTDIKPVKTEGHAFADTTLPANGMSAASAAALLRSPSPSAKVEVKASIPTLPEDLSVPAGEGSDASPAPSSPHAGGNKGNVKAGPARRKKRDETADRPTQFIHHLPRAEERALTEFDVLEENTFQFKYLGRSGQQEDMMICDCQFDPDEDDPEQACGARSNCINRLTQVECLKNECQTKKHCLNQRFSKRQYANVEVVQTEKKGYGLRAGTDLKPDEFVYEYIGEVVSQAAFLKRMQDYADEGIQHFYFMMLQKEEYIDATKKGGIARFANHSCNPNCYVAKWVVGKRMRMGIFAKRHIERGEELTFNYNVDRYGHTAQICYCDEPNCVGTIGGKTQTDLGGMDDLYIDALGIADDVAALGLKGSKKKKGRKLDEDFIPVLKAVEEPEVPKVVAAIRQCTDNKKVLCKLLERVRITEDEVVRGQFMRMHGFALMWTVMTESPEDVDIIRSALQVMTTWKPKLKNKIEDAKIEEPVSQCLESTEEDVRSMAAALLDAWKDLKSAYRVPRRIHVPDAADDAIVDGVREATPPEARRSRAHSAWDAAPKIEFQLAPIKRLQPIPRPAPPPPPEKSVPPPPAAPVFDRSKLEAILALAKTNQEAGAAAAAAAAESLHLKSEQMPSPHKRRSGTKDGDRERKRPRMSEGEKREKKLMKMVGEVVVRTMSKYKHEMERETFKQYAKECTTVLFDKEKRGRSFTEGKPLEKFGSEKEEKMKKFIKEFAHKILKKLKEKGKLVSQRRSKDSSSTPDTPVSNRDRRHYEDDDVNIVQDMFGPDEDADDDEVESGNHAESALASDDRSPEDSRGEFTPNHLAMIQDLLDKQDQAQGLDKKDGDDDVRMDDATGLAYPVIVEKSLA